ncbi:hypothetical protein D3C81_1265620 [compost metagenome]
MRPSRFVLYSLLPLFAACQVWTPKSADLQSATRQQGEITSQGNMLLFKPCNEQRRFSIEDSGNTGLAREAASLFRDGGKVLFADVRGTFSGSSASGTDGKLGVDKLFRLQREGFGCDDPNFKRLIVRASGNEPGWSVMVNSQGMLVQRAGQPQLALPYVVESLPDGSSSYSSEADGEKLELWVAPAHCVNDMSGTLSNLSATLHLQGQVMRGCAYPGGASGD